MTDESKIIDDDKKKSYELYTQESKTTNYFVYLGSSFDAPFEYVKLFHALENAGTGDRFTFYLNSYGGRVDCLLQFISKLKSTKAWTTCIVESTCYSCGAIFPFACSEIQMKDHSSLMWHMYSSGFGRTKGNEIELSIDNTSSMFKKLMTDVCGKVLTKKEIIDIMDGKDLYLDKDEIYRRLKK